MTSGRRAINYNFRQRQGVTLSGLVYQGETMERPEWG